ncbi:MAG TPA: LeuA family protein [Thermoanaerobaculia bacterium]|nr:LeuA family protein [Thermoanaerobaculia bacterium]
MAALDESELVYDWNTIDEGDLKPARGTVELDDETLRDGLQSPSVRSPSLEAKLEILHAIADLGIESADVGLPGAGPHVVATVRRLVEEIRDQKLPVEPNCAARTVLADIEPIAEISQQVGVPIEVACFLGSSPIRQYAESWDLDRMLRLVEESVRFSVDHDLPVMFVTEDTTRAAPEDLRRLYTTAVEAGAGRICIADTVGHATPNGARRLVRFLRGVVGDEVKIDWHGHKDRGISVMNALAAAEAGADRLHGTAVGIGERVGNTPIDLLLVNMKLLGWIDRDLTRLEAYCRLVSKETGVPLPDNYPVVGRDAFRTGTGVHASAILKARKKGDEWLADRVYSSIPASWIGRRQEVEVGPMSGESNVVCWLEARGFEAEPGLVGEIFRAAKEADQVLAEAEVLAICDGWRERRAS